MHKYPILRNELSNALSRLSFVGCEALAAAVDVLGKSLAVFVSVAVATGSLGAAACFAPLGPALTVTFLRGLLPAVLVFVLATKAAPTEISCLPTVTATAAGTSFAAAVVWMLTALTPTPTFFFSSSCMRSIRRRYSLCDATGKCRTAWPEVKV